MTINFRNVDENLHLQPSFVFGSDFCTVALDKRIMRILKMQRRTVTARRRNQQQQKPE